MADNVTSNNGSGGPTFATDDVAGVHFPRSKITLGADGVNGGDVSTSNPMPITGTVVASLTGSLPAGTANIGDMDVVSLVPGTSATNLGKAEDAPHVSADTGVMALAVRNDALAATFTSADGDYSPISVNNKGVVRIDPSGTTTQPISHEALSSIALDYSSNNAVSMRIAQSDTVLSVDNQGAFAVQITGAALTSLQLLDDMVFAEDAPHATGDKGFQVLTVRQNSPTALSGANGDYQPLITNADGAVYVYDATLAPLAGTVSGGKILTQSVVDEEFNENASLPIRVIAALPSGTNTIGSMNVITLVPGTSATNLGKAEDAPHTTGDTGVMMLAVRNDALGATLTNTDGDYSPIAVNSKGVVRVDPAGTTPQPVTNAGTFAVQDGPTTSGGCSIYDARTGANTNSASIKASPGQLYNVIAINMCTTRAFLKLYNKASAPNAGSDTPVMTIPVPAGNGTNDGGVSLNLSKAVEFATGIAIAITRGIATNDTTATAANDVAVTLLYK